MKDKEGTLITDREDVTKYFKKVFEKMLNITTLIELKDSNSINTVEQQLE